MVVLPLLWTAAAAHHSAAVDCAAVVLVDDCGLNICTIATASLLDDHMALLLPESQACVS